MTYLLVTAPFALCLTYHTLFQIYSFSFKHLAAIISVSATNLYCPTHKTLQSPLYLVRERLWKLSLREDLCKDLAVQLATCLLLSHQTSPTCLAIAGHNGPPPGDQSRSPSVSSVAGRQPPWAVVTMSSPLLSTLSSLSTLISLVLVGTQHTYCYDYSVYATHTVAFLFSGPLDVLIDYVY